MAKKDLEKQKQKNLVKRLWDNKGPRYLQMMDQFIVDNFNNEDKDFRRDAHKLLGKLFDSQVPKKLITEQQGGQGYLNARLEKALDIMMADAPKMIEVEEAEIVDEAEAISLRNASRK